MAISLYKIKKWTKMILGKSQFHVVQDAGKCYSKNEIKGYYNNLTEKVTRFGFPHGTVPTYPDENGKIIEFSIGIFQYGLACYDLYLLNDNKQMLEDATFCAEWAITHQLEDGSWDTFSTEDPANPFSSMAQGEAISLLSRIYLHHKSEKYLNTIQKAKNFLLKPLNEGGCTSYEGNKVYFHEITNWTPVLNGWIFSLWGLFDYCKLCKDDSEAKTILDRTIVTLADELPLYDTGYWSRYDKEKMITSPFYHALHIEQLKVLYDLTGIDAFNQYAKKWKKYQDKWFNKKLAFAVKVWQKVTD